MNMTACLIAIAAIAPAASPATASARRTTTTETYRVTYEGSRDVYCIRFFSDAQAADPHPGGPGIACYSRAAWAKHGVQIDDPQHDGAKAARS
ncbi:hypothetical protein BH10PSE14_BH10PSE14_32100 [soil metagenome]